MLKYRIEIREIQSDHMFAVPQFLKNKFITVENRKAAENYILTELKDGYGNKFKKATVKEKEMFKIDFISKTGAIVLHNYQEPKFKKVL